MSDRNRWHVVPRTTWMCVLMLLIGAALVVQAALRLGAGQGDAAALEVVVAVLGAVVALCALAGLVFPRLRGR
jgi:uncharacterized membrane protein YhaH (DUF805 family)